MSENQVSNAQLQAEIRQKLRDLQIELIQLIEQTWQLSLATPQDALLYSSALAGLQKKVQDELKQLQEMCLAISQAENSPHSNDLQLELFDGTPDNLGHNRVHQGLPAITG